MKLPIKLFLVAILILTMGCVQMRDYLGIRDGSFGLDIKKGFDQGGDKKDYYLIREGIGIVKQDTKNEIMNKLTHPDKIGMTYEGYEYWVYQKRGLKLFFYEDRLKGWEEIL